MGKITRRGFVKGAALAAPLAFAPFTMAQTSSAERFDFVVVGAGHNSLITACYLAKAGFKCIVLEGRPLIGGGTKTAELTLRGFRHDACSIIHFFIQGNPLMRNNELKLGDYGLEYIYADPLFHLAFPDGSYITKWRDLDRTCEEIAKYSRKDAEAWRRMANESGAVRPILAAVNYSPIGWGKSLDQRLAEHPQGKLWQRRIAMSKWDVLQRNFEDERTVLAMMAPFPRDVMSPFTGMLAYPNKNEAIPIPKGGSGMLAVALGRYFEAHGGVVVVNKPVEQLIVESGKCVGVECSDGSSYRASKAVVSTVHIKRLIDMAPRELWGEDFIEGVKTFRAGAGSFNSLYATTEPLKFPVKGGMLSPVLAANLQSCKRALSLDSEAALGEFNIEEPVLQFVQPSVVDPTRAPAGMHTIRVLSELAPYDLKDGGPERWDEIKEQVADAHLKAVQRVAPNLTNDKILARFVATPVDIDRMNPAMWHGSSHGGTDGPAQDGAMRPVPGWAQYRMPIPGLYQTGQTTHPGAAVTGGPGRNAAMVILKDFGTSIEEVLEKRESS
jgi:phytoene dehydrogenase-like protein